MDPLREEYTEVDTCITCPRCGDSAWFPRPKALAAVIVCPKEGCGCTFVWDRWVSRERGVEQSRYLRPRVPGLLESMFQRSWEIVGLGICLLVFAVPLVQASLTSAATKTFATVYFSVIAASAVGLGAMQRRVNRLRAAHRADERTHILQRSPTICAVASAGWAPTRALTGDQGNMSSKQVSQRRPPAV